MDNTIHTYIDFFAGIGGWSLGAFWAGVRFNAHFYSEIDSYASKVYQLRFSDAIPLGDITKVHFNKLINSNTKYIFSGSFPCQDLSGSGKRKGLKGERSSLWFEYLRLIKEVRPAVAMVENVGDLAIRGLDRVIADLSSIGYSACWRIISAADMGAPHLRERLWIIAYPNSDKDNTSLMSFRLRRHIYSDGSTKNSIEDISYFDRFFVGAAGDDSVFAYGKSIGKRMPKGGYLTGNGEVYAVPAWEKGLEVYEVLGDANDNIGGSSLKRDAREVDQRRESSNGTFSSVEFTGTGSGHEDVANSDSSRRSGHIPDEEKGLRRSSLGCKQYSELEGAWDIKPGVFELVDGVCPWYVGIDRDIPFPVTFEKVKDHNKMLSCYGNAILPQIAWVIFRRIKPLIPDCYLG